MSRHERWKVASVELNESLPELSCDKTYDGVRAVFFWKGIPLGHCRLATSELPLSPRQLANVAAVATAVAAGDYLLDRGFRSALPGLPEPQLENSVQALADLVALEYPIAQLTHCTRAPEPGSHASISVAVCTRDRPVDLARCLASFDCLTEQPQEILVIDNAPTSHRTREVVVRFPGVHYYCEPRRGLSAARNAALAVASGDIVAFVDDDVVVHPDWVTRIRGCFEDEKVMAATGLVLPAELETPAQSIFEQSFQFFHQGYRRRYFDSAYFAALKNKGVPVWSLGAGANMAIRRRAWELGYRFDTRLGPGVFGGCGEDSEFWYRILADGWSCVYEPSACVFHYHRRELSELRRLVHQYMKGHVAALILQFFKTGDIGNLRRLFLQLPAEYMIQVLRLIATGFPLEQRILMRGALGCLSGLGFVFSLWQRQPSHPFAYEPAEYRTDIARRST